MSSEGKNARNQLNNQATWSQNQAQDWATRGSDAWNKANEGQNWAIKYWQNKAENPAFSADAAKRTGQDIVNVEQPISNMWKRAAETQSMWENSVPKAADVAGTLAANTATKGERLNDYQHGQQHIIDAGKAEMGGNIQNASGAAMDNLTKTYGDAATGWNDAYNDLTGNINTTRDSLLGKTDAAYADMGKNVDSYAKSVEMLRPGSEAAAARTARAFAPAMAAAQGRLRRGGVDPNGVQAASVLGSISGQQAQAVDDALANGTAQYVDAQGNLVGMRNNVAAGKLNTEVGLTKDALKDTTALGQTQAGVNRDMTLAQGAETRNQIRSDAAALNDLAKRSQDQTLSLNDSVHQQGQGLLDESSKNALTVRDIANQDLATHAGLMNDQNNIDLKGIDLKTGQFNLGLGVNQLNQQGQDTGAQNLTNIAQANFGNAGNAANIAGNYSQDAAGLWNKIYGNEAANAGWGTKMLTGLGTSFLTGGLGGTLGSSLGNWIKRPGSTFGQGLGGGVWGG